MNDKIIGIVGTAMGVVGSVVQTKEVLQIISIIITIIGGVITWFVIPVLNWYKHAKKDGKITTDELIEGAKIAKDGIDKVKEASKGVDEDAKD